MFNEFIVLENLNKALRRHCEGRLPEGLSFFGGPDRVTLGVTPVKWCVVIGSYWAEEAERVLKSDVKINCIAELCAILEPARIKDVVYS